VRRIVARSRHLQRLSWLNCRKQHGDLLSISYNDGTAGVTIDYDRRGRQTQVVRNGITTTRTFNDAGQPLAESYAGGTLAGLSVNATYDTLLRRATINFQNGGAILGSSTYGYDNASRLASVGDGTPSTAGRNIIAVAGSQANQTPSTLPEGSQSSPAPSG